MAITPEDRRGARNARGGQIALVVGILVVVLAALWFLFLRDEPVVETAPAPAPIGTPEPTPLPESTTKPGKGPVETFEVFAPKDPFRPAIAAAVDGTPVAGSGTQTAGGEVTPGNGITRGPSAGTDGNGGDSIGGHRVRLVDVFTQGGEQRARVQVDGTVYTVEEGDRFADNFELLSIEGRCASLLFGDDQFTLCEGEEILK